MQTRRLMLLATCLPLLLMLVLPAFADTTPDTGMSIPYDKFNSSSETAFELSYVYSPAYEITIDYHLTRNGTASGIGWLKFAANATGHSPGIQVGFSPDTSTVTVQYVTTTSTVTIGSATFSVNTDDDEVDMVMYEDHVDISVNNGTWTKAIDDFAVSGWNLGQVDVHGEQTVGLFSAGYVSLKISETSGSMTDMSSTISSFIPAIVSIAMLGVAIGFIKKMGS